MVDIQIMMQMMSTVLSASVLVAASYYTLTLKKEEKMRKALRTREFFRRSIQNIEFGLAFANVLSVEEGIDPEEYKKMISDPEYLSNVYLVLGSFNIFGYAIRKKILEMGYLYDMVASRRVVELWEKLEPLVKVLRDGGEPNAYKSFEWLYHEVKKRVPEIVTHAQTQEIQTRTVLNAKI